MHTCSNTRLLLAMVLIATGVSCTRAGGDAVVVHIFRDPAAPVAAQFTRAIEHFQSQSMQARSGKPIVIAPYDVRDYAGFLKEIGGKLTPDFIVLNSRADAEKNPVLQRELARAIELGGEGRHCVVLIPSWVSGEELAASRMFMNFLVSSGDLW